MVQIGHDAFLKISKNFKNRRIRIIKILVHYFCVCVSYVLKKFDSIRTKLTEEIDFEVYPMVIPAMALLQQHVGRRDILIEPAARRRAAIEARAHSELGRWELGAQSGRKNHPACLSVCLCVSVRL